MKPRPHASPGPTSRKTKKIAPNRSTTPWTTEDRELSSSTPGPVTTWRKSTRAVSTPATPLPTNVMKGVKRTFHVGRSRPFSESHSAMRQDYATGQAGPRCRVRGEPNLGWRHPRAKELNVKFEIYKDKAGEFRFRIRATNGNILASSEGYKAKASAQNAIDRIKSDAATAPVVDES